VKDATGTFTMAFVFLVAFAWMSAGLALSMRAQRSVQGPAPPEPLPAQQRREGIGAGR
jgi:hypothetical protein